MEEIDFFLNSKETYNKVLEILNDKIGDDGETIEFLKDKDSIIFGGSIGNTLYHLYYGTEKCVINDVDVIVGDYEELLGGGIGETNIIPIKPSTKRIIFFHKNGGHSLKYVSSKFFNNKTNLLRLNNNIKINIEVSSLPFFWVTEKRDIKNFDIKELYSDINNSHCGINLIEKNLVYGDNFKNFLKTGNLEITNLSASSTPIITLLRLIKKSKELGLDVNLDMEYEKMSNYFFMDDSVFYINQTQYRYLSQRNRYFRGLSKYFIIKHVDNFKDTNLGDDIIKQYGINKDCWIFLPIKPFIHNDINKIKGYQKIKNMWFK